MMKEEKKKGALVPRLRFPEFRDAGEWAGKKIQQIAKIYKGKGISKADISSDGKQLCIRYGELYTSYSEVILEVISKTSLPADTLFLSKINDVIIPASGETKIDIATSSCVMKDDVALGGDLNIIRSCQNGVFISYYVNGNLKEEIAKKAQGDTVVHLYPAQIGQLDIAIPSKKEQKRIADCLSSLDERIAAEADKLDALKAHKNGLLKQLFPSEGETLPALRFPEFRDAGEWEKADFGTIAKFLSGGTPSKDISDYWGGDIPWISASSMHNTKIEKSDCNITRLAVSNGARIAKKGTLLLLVRGSMLHKRILLGISEVDVSFNQDVKALAINADITELYLMYFLMASESKLLAAVVQTGIGAGKLDTEDLNNFPIMMPSLIEQKRISDCLSSLDELITAQAQKIELLTSHKKGLMQQLFPVLDEAKA